MTKLWNRAVDVRIGTIMVNDLRIVFDVYIDNRPDPNTAQVQIYNLSEETRNSFEVRRDNISIMAGYKELVGQIFLGSLARINHVREGADIITRIESGDGLDAMRRRANQSFAPGTSFKEIIGSASDALGLGGLMDAAKEFITGDRTEAAKNGLTLSGNLWNEIKKLSSMTGYEPSIQGGQLQLIPKGSVTSAPAVLLTPNTGMIGSPELGEEETEDGIRPILKVNCLLNYELLPGRQLRVESMSHTGFFRCEKIRHRGDTHGQEWYSEIEATFIRGGV